MIGNGSREQRRSQRGSSYVFQFGVLMVIQVIIVVLVLTGTAAETALAVAGGGGLAAAKVAGLFAGPAAGRPVRRRGGR
ncbi:MULTISPECIES: hypothetical protein [Streptomycetaceae]|uniref:hypothetical protein n=1 Tax=Streptomycetaceae TaxID=2062 RepID=UPI00093F554C|nr:hypothetical protein [Streptomyces sp. CB02056]OKH97570.1 hypothetical protein AMK13_38415 [Streptomyces sp. CB02056]